MRTMRQNLLDTISAAQPSVEPRERAGTDLIHVRRVHGELRQQVAAVAAHAKKAFFLRGKDFRMRHLRQIVSKTVSQTRRAL